ncbi:hypothetical protein E4U41_003655, partial [Claviceps citrina]
MKHNTLSLAVAAGAAQQVAATFGGLGLPDLGKAIGLGSDAGAGAGIGAGLGLGLGAGASFNFDLGFSKAKSFNCPGNVMNECTPEQEKGWDFQDLQPGSFSKYLGFQFGGGWSCEKKLGLLKRGSVQGRTFGEIQKVISGICGLGSGAGLDISVGAGTGVSSFSIASIDISTEFDARLEFQYDMADGSVCKHFADCKKSGSTIVNNQCGGAKKVRIIYPKQGVGMKPQCKITCQKINWHCGPPSTPKSKPFTTPALIPGPSTHVQQTTPGVPGTTDVNTNSQPGQDTTYGVPGTTNTQPGQQTTPGVPATTNSQPGQDTTYGVPGTTNVNTNSQPGQQTTPGVPATTNTQPDQDNTTYGVPGTTNTQPGQQTTPGVPATTNTQPDQDTTYGVPGTTNVNTNSQPGQQTTPGVPANTDYQPSQPMTGPATIVSSYGAMCSGSTTTTKTVHCGPHVPECPDKTGMQVVTVVVPMTGNVCPAQPTGNNPQPTGNNPQVTGYNSQPTGNNPQVTGYNSQPTGNNPQLTGNNPQPTGQTPGTPGTPSTPNQAPPCPQVVPRCLNTFLELKSKCKDNKDAGCYCPSKEFTDVIFNCIYAHGDNDNIISEAISFFQGMCAPYIPQNPAIATGCKPIIEIITVTGTPRITNVPYTTIAYTGPDAGHGIVTVPNIAMPTGPAGGQPNGPAGGQPSCSAGGVNCSAG